MKKLSTKGFTLIELLVVIAIIGILAALVLVALGNARDKAQDAKIKSDIGQMRTLAEIHFDSATQSYTGLGSCIGGTASDCKGGIAASMATLTADITTAGGSTTAFSGASTFCIESVLNDASFVCVDNSGVTASNSATACAALSISC